MSRRTDHGGGAHPTRLALPLAPVISQSRKRLNQMLFDYLIHGFGTVALVLGIGAVGVFADRITRPVAEMTGGTRDGPAQISPLKPR